MSAYQHIHEMGSHSGFLQDLSCMFDGELDEQAASRAMLHIEECGSCRSFFEDLRDQVRAHRDMQSPDELFAHVALLRATDSASLLAKQAGSIPKPGADFIEGAESIDGFVVSSDGHTVALEVLPLPHSGEGIRSTIRLLDPPLHEFLPHQPIAQREKGLPTRGTRW